MGSLHEMNRPDRDSRIKVDPKFYRKKGLSKQDFELWNIGAGQFNDKVVSRLTTNDDINSILHYRPQFGIEALNPYYNDNKEKSL